MALLSKTTLPPPPAPPIELTPQEAANLETIRRLEQEELEAEKLRLEAEKRFDAAKNLLGKEPSFAVVMALRELINEYIDAAALRDHAPGMPLQTIRNGITDRAHGCECRQWLILNAEREALARRLAKEEQERKAAKK
jgi:hypothetical protein